MDVKQPVCPKCGKPLVLSQPDGTPLLDAYVHMECKSCKKRYKILRSSIDNAPVSVGKIQRPNPFLKRWWGLIPFFIIIILFVVVFIINNPGGNSLGESCTVNGYPGLYGTDGNCHYCTSGSPSVDCSSSTCGNSDAGVCCCVDNETHNPTTQPGECPDGSDCCSITQGIRKDGFWIPPGCTCPSGTTWVPEGVNVINGVRYEFCDCNCPD